jgi:pyroglutamyl-peptidase
MAQMKNVLVTGFEPFGGDTLNPSALAVQALNGRMVAGRRVTGIVLPCVFGKSLAVLKQEILRTLPELVICTGEAGGRGEITLERVAINIEDADIPDNAGNQPVDHPVVRGGPAAYWSTLPVKAIVAALREADLPAATSQSAGTFVCNHVFYGLMRTLARKRTVRGGFIHVPYLPEQARLAAAGSPSLPLDEIIRGLEIAIKTSLTTRHDLRAVGGATC